MPILKGIKVDEFENVTILVVKEIAFRHKRVGDGLHLVISEDKDSQSEVMFQNTETESICWSDQCHALDMIIDFPNEKSMQALIDLLVKTKHEMYPRVIPKRTIPELPPEEKWCSECDGEGSMDPNPPIVDCGKCNGTGAVPDEDYIKARIAVIKHQQCSIQFLQRKVNVSYIKAESLIEKLEKALVVGSAENSKERKVLIKE